MAVRKIVTKPASKSDTKPVVAPKAKIEAKPETKKPVVQKPLGTERVVHGIEASVNWAGPSKGENSRRSKTVIPVAAFGTQKDMVLTIRRENILKAYKEKYGKEPFVRGDFDAGVLKAAVLKGIVQCVKGDGSLETDTYKFV